MDCVHMLQNCGKDTRRVVQFSQPFSRSLRDGDAIMMMSEECHAGFSSEVEKAVLTSVYSYSSEPVSYALALLCARGYVLPESFEGEDVVSVKRLWEIISNSFASLRRRGLISKDHAKSMMSGRSGQGFEEFMSSYSTMESMRKSNSTTEELSANADAKQAILGGTLEEEEKIPSHKAFRLVRGGAGEKPLAIHSYCDRKR